MGARGKRYTAKETKELKKEFLEKLAKSLGVMSPVYEAMGISHNTIDSWLAKDAEFKAKVDFISQIRATDFVESQMYKKIKEGDSKMIMFYMRTKGRSRGYVERRELTGADGQPIAPPAKEVDLSGLTDEQRAVLLSIGENAVNDTKH